MGRRLPAGATRRQIDVVVKSGDSGRQNTTQAGFLGTQTFIETWPQATQQIVNVLVKNAAEISDPANRDAWSAEMAQQSQIPKALLLEALQPQDLNFTTSPRIDPFLTDSFSSSVEQAKSGRLIRSAFDVKQWVDGQFVEQALKTQQLETAGHRTMPKVRRKTPVNPSPPAPAAEADADGRYGG